MPSAAAPACPSRACPRRRARPRAHVERLERPHEDRGVRLAPADFGGEHAESRRSAMPSRSRSRCRRPGGSIAFETSPSLSPRSRSDSSSACVVDASWTAAPTPRAPPRGSARARLRRRRSRLAEQAHERGPGTRPLRASRAREQRQVPLAEAHRERWSGSRPSATSPARARLRAAPAPTSTASACRPSRREPPRARLGRLPASWRGGSSGRCSPSRPSRSSSTTADRRGRDGAVRPRCGVARAARVADRRGDRARGRAHRARASAASSTRASATRPS